jgi:primary-amine oxidase
MPRRVGYCLIAFSLLVLPFGWSARSAVSQPKDKDKQGTVEIGEGRQISWAGWKFAWSVHPRNGLVLENVSFQGRSVLKYAGLAEIFVPYNQGQPRPEDFGGGISNRLVELFPGKDCVPGSLSCFAWNAQGKEEGKRFIMLHEEGTGLSYMGNLGRAYGKTLVLWCTYNLGGYYYISRWRFRDDGYLIPEVGLTGPLQHVGKGESSPFGSLVGKNQTFAPSHVHNIYFCLDLDIDGTDNVVEEFNYQPDAPGSPSAKHSWTPLKKETARTANAASFRSWRVVNPKSKNVLGLPRSYELIPGGNGVYRGSADEKFAQAELWVTKFHPKEHPNDNRSLSVILPSYMNDEAIENENVVLWYVLHVHHIPRTEDWPGMPVEWVSFTLRPRDFLDASPVRPSK